MIRTPPTRIELKLDDLNEYEVIKKELEEKKKQQKSSNLLASGSQQVKSKQEMVNERIGYCPKVHIAS